MKLVNAQTEVVEGGERYKRAVYANGDVLWFGWILIEVGSGCWNGVTDKRQRTLEKIYQEEMDI